MASLTRICPAQRAIHIKNAFRSVHSSSTTCPALRPSAAFQWRSNLSSNTSKRSLLSKTLRRSGFHSSSRALILPPPPQVIEGTVNDPTPIPPPSPTHGSYHWTFERILSAALVPLTIAPFAAGSLNPTMDAILAASILIHSHMGFQQIIIDYIPAGRYKRSRFLFWWALRAATLFVGVGLYEFETNDVGLTEAIKRIWRA